MSITKAIEALAWFIENDESGPDDLYHQKGLAQGKEALASLKDMDTDHVRDLEAKYLASEAKAVRLKEALDRLSGEVMELRVVPFKERERIRLAAQRVLTGE